MNAVVFEMPPRSGKTAMQCAALKTAERELYVTYSGRAAWARARQYGFSPSRALGLFDRMAGLRADVIRIDDPCIARSDSRGIRGRRVIDWLEELISTRLTRDGVAVITTTPWTNRCVARTLVERRLGMTGRVVRFPGVDRWLAEYGDPHPAPGCATCGAWPTEVCLCVG